MLQLKVEAIKWETVDTATFFLSEINGNPIKYTAGQFITLVFSHHAEEIRRSYSLSSSPDEKLLSVTIKRITNGEISRFMLTRVKVGDVLNAVEPAGRFTVNDFAQPKDVFMFAGGSGIVPVFSQLKYILNQPGKSRLILIYSSQDPRSVLFKTDLDKLAKAYPDRLKIIYLLSSEGNRLHNIRVEELVKENGHFDNNLTEFYLCGPFSYMRMIRLTLLYMGVEAAQIRKENFVLETVQVSPTPINYPPQQIRIRFKNEVHDLIVAENQSILQAALQNNIPLPYSCRAGICSACMAKCGSGKVTMAVNDVLTDNDLALGWVLTCTGHPVGDGVVIEVL
ncbi:MAG: 2Fe-2S iron-sulfur cluster-binding protein [Mucilaginibacter sp.]